VVLTIVVLVTAFLALTPLAFLLYQSFTDSNGIWTTANYERAAGAPLVGTMVANSLKFASGSTALALVIGTTLAYLHVRTDVPFRRLVFIGSVIPVIVPGILYTISWILLASPAVGMLNVWLEPLLGGRVFDIYTLGGMTWVEGTSLSPVVFLLMVAGFRAMDPSLEEAALTSGANGNQIIRRVTLPLVVPALAASALISFIRAIEAFETPALLGMPSQTWVVTSRIWSELNRFPPRFGPASVYSVWLLIISAIGVFLYGRLGRSGMGNKYETVGGKGFRARPRPLGRWRWVAGSVVLAYFTITVFLPVAILMYMSFMPTVQPPSIASLGEATLGNYRQLITEPGILRAFANSVFLAVVSATVVMLLMAVASWLVVRTKVRGRWMVDTLAFMPLVFPGLVLGVAILIFYIRVPIPIYGTIAILLIAYVTKYIPYGIRYASSSMYQVGRELEESASVSGATWWIGFRRVMLPLIMPGLIAGWIYIAAVSLRELSASILLYSPGTQVLAVTVWELWEYGRTTVLSALGMTMILLLVIIVSVAYRLGSRFGLREEI